MPLHLKGADGKLPCVVYCHSNSGSRRDAEEAVLLLVPLGISVFAVDFSVRSLRLSGAKLCSLLAALSSA